MFPSLWILNAAGGDANLARAIGQVVDPVTLAARAAPAYALSAALGLILGLVVALAFWAGSHFKIPAQGKWLLALIVLIFAATLTAFSLPSWTYMYATAAITAGGYLVVHYNPFTAERGFAPVVVTMVLIMGLFGMGYLAPFPRVTVHTADATIHGHLVEFEPTGGAWLLVRPDPDATKRELHFITAAEIRELTYATP